MRHTGKTQTRKSTVLHAVPKVVVCAAIFLPLSSLWITAIAKSPQLKKGESTYMASCEACHMAGKNVIKPGKDIVVSNKIQSVKLFGDFLREEHGVMPSFRRIADDKDVLVPLYKYVRTLKDQDWQYYPSKEVPETQKKGTPNKNKDSSPMGND